jgi:hypothetical protein
MLSGLLRGYGYIVFEPPPQGWVRWISVRFAIMLAGALVAIAAFVLQPRKADEPTPPPAIEKPRAVPALIQPWKLEAPPTSSIEQPGKTIVAEPQWQVELPSSISKYTDKDLIGVKLVSPQGTFLGYVASVMRDERGTLESLGLSASQQPDAPVTKVKIGNSPR